MNSSTRISPTVAGLRKHANELCNNRRKVTAATALILAPVFGMSPDFWLNIQRRNDLKGGDEQPARARANRTREAARRRGVISAVC